MTAQFPPSYISRVTTAADALAKIFPPSPKPAAMFYRVGSPLGIPLNYYGPREGLWMAIQSHVGWLEDCEPDEISTFDAWWNEDDYAEIIVKNGVIVGSLDRVICADDIEKIERTRE